MQLQLLEARRANDFDSAFSAMTREHARALVVLPSPMFYGEHKRIVGLALTNRLPTIFAFREAADAGIRRRAQIDGDQIHRHASSNRNECLADCDRGAVGRVAWIPVGIAAGDDPDPRLAFGNEAGSIADGFAGCDGPHGQKF